MRPPGTSPAMPRTLRDSSTFPTPARPDSPRLAGVVVASLSVAKSAEDGKPRYVVNYLDVDAGRISFRTYAEEWLASRTFSPLTYRTASTRS